MGIFNYFTTGVYIGSFFFLMMLFFDWIGVRISGGFFTAIGLTTIFMMFVFAYGTYRVSLR